MALIERGGDEFPHLVTARVDIDLMRRTRQPHFRRAPEPDSRFQHGNTLATETVRAVQSIASTRRDSGIDPQRLMVLEFTSVNIDLRQTLEARFRALVVDERKSSGDDQDNYRFLVQFPDLAAIELFNAELRAYQTGRVGAGLVPPAERTNFFNGMQSASIPTREDRIGARLKAEGMPPSGMFYADVDLWHPGGDTFRALIEDIREFCARYRGTLTESVRTSTMLLAKVYGPPELMDALLNLDVIARLDLPPRLSEAYRSLLLPMETPQITGEPATDMPVVCIIDSGVASAHPLLQDWLIEEADFGTGEPVAVHRHGTGVAGLVIYGSVHDCLLRGVWQGRVRICSAKVLKNLSSIVGSAYDEAVFPDNQRAEEIVEQAIRYFASERQCRIFNLSVGSRYDIYAGQRQFVWAEVLDRLARELDIVIVVSAGNRGDVPVPEGSTTRDALQAGVRNQLLEPAQRIINPGTAALAITVGSIARNDALGNDWSDGMLRDAVAGSCANMPSPFTRTGPGYAIDRTKASIKPDLAAYGGNLALRTLVGAEPRWMHQHAYLGEPTLNMAAEERHVCSEVGTSYACPQVSHAAALALSSLEDTLGRSPTANSIRALVGSCSSREMAYIAALGGEEDTIRFVGYGVSSTAHLLSSRSNSTRIVAEDTINLDAIHVYEFALPNAFLTTPGQRGMSISLAYDPPVRSSRKEYLARTMWAEAFHGLTPDQIAAIRSQRPTDEGVNAPDSAAIKLRPPRQKAQWSTLQVRSKEWRRTPTLRAVANSDGPIIHVVVGCQRRFAVPTIDLQRYSLVVCFWHEDSNIRLYQSLQASLRVPRARARIVATG